MKDFMVMFIFCFFVFFDWKDSFLGQIFSKKIKIVEAEIWNLDCYQWWFSIFPCLDRKYSFSIN